jgi:hypothetical protein
MSCKKASAKANSGEEYKEYKERSRIQELEGVGGPACEK